jgi:protein-disulfide isomerase
MRPSRRQLVAAAALGFVLPAPLFAAAARSQPLPDDMSLGNPDARVTVIEYASASCPHCAHFNNEVFPAFKAKYIDTGRVHYVFREFLTAPAEIAAASFLIARCAGKDKYFSVLDSIFRGQEQMYATGDVKGTLLKAAQGAGMNETQVNACLTDEIAGDQLNARVQRYAKDDGINVTPTFVVNGKKLEGVQTLAQLDAAIAAAQGRRPG